MGYCVLKSCFYSFFFRRISFLYESASQTNSNALESNEKAVNVEVNSN